MQQAFITASVWLGLALVATFLASRLKVSLALMEIIVGVVAAAVIGWTHHADVIGLTQPWLVFIASTGAVLLTFLAGVELEPDVMRAQWKEVSAVGLVGFFAPFLGCAAVARYALGGRPSRAGSAGLPCPRRRWRSSTPSCSRPASTRPPSARGSSAPASSTILGTVIALGLIFAPFTWRTIAFIVGSIAAFALLPFVTPRLVATYGHKTAAFRTKWVLFILFGLGGLALWAGSEAVLPAYLAGMVLSPTLGRDPVFMRRLRTLTVGFLTPFYFLRAGSLVSLGVLVAAPIAFVVLFAAKVGSKIFGLFPVISAFREHPKERWYYTLMMSTGLTFGTISALFGLTHGIVTPDSTRTWSRWSLAARSSRR